MINLHAHVYNPFSKRGRNEWDILFHRSGKISRWKAWELELSATSVIVGASFLLNFRTSHAGLNIMVGLFGFECSLDIYDSRHWNEETNDWHKHED